MFIINTLLIVILLSQLEQYYLQSVPNCQTDLDTTLCSICSPGFLNQEGVCKTVCDSNYFQSTQSGRQICTRCMANCDICSNITTCLNCTNPTHYNQNYSCVTECSRGYYNNSLPSSYFCSPCMEGCEECVVLNVCIQCQIGYFLNRTDNRCYQRCPTKTYQNTQTRTCDNCASLCQECNGPSDSNCTQCINPLLILDNRCLNECPSTGYHTNPQTRVCEKCPDFCSQCDSLGQCIRCIHSFSYDVVADSCVQDCHLSCSSCVESDDKFYHCKTCLQPEQRDFVVMDSGLEYGTCLCKGDSEERFTGCQSDPPQIRSLASQIIQYILSGLYQVILPDNFYQVINLETQITIYQYAYINEIYGYSADYNLQTQGIIQISSIPSMPRQKSLGNTFPALQTEHRKNVQMTKLKQPQFWTEVILILVLNVCAVLLDYIINKKRNYPTFKSFFIVAVFLSNFQQTMLLSLYAFTHGNYNFQIILHLLLIINFLVYLIGYGFFCWISNIETKFKDHIGFLSELIINTRRITRNYFVWILSKKIINSFVIVFLYKNSQSQAAFTFSLEIINILFLILFKPFRNKFHNIGAIAFSICTTIVISIIWVIIAQNDDLARKTDFTTLLIGFIQAYNIILSIFVSFKIFYFLYMKYVSDVPVKIFPNESPPKPQYEINNSENDPSWNKSNNKFYLKDLRKQPVKMPKEPTLESIEVNQTLELNTQQDHLQNSQLHIIKKQPNNPNIESQPVIQSNQKGLYESRNEMVFFDFRQFNEHISKSTINQDPSKQSNDPQIYNPQLKKSRRVQYKQPNNIYPTE